MCPIYSLLIIVFKFWWLQKFFPGSWCSSYTNTTVILSTQKNSVISNMSSTRTILHTIFFIFFTPFPLKKARISYPDFSSCWIFFEKLSPVNFTPRRITSFFLYFNIWKYIHACQSLCLLAFTFFLLFFSCLLFKSNSIFFNTECHKF